MKTLSIALIFIVFLSFGKITLWSEQSYTGDQIYTHVNVNNVEKFNSRDVRVRVTPLDPIYDPQYETFGRINSRGTASTIFIWEVPLEPRREVWFRFTATDKDGNRDVVHLPLLI